MKQLIISLAIGCLIASGFSQSQKNQGEKLEQLTEGPKMKNVRVERDYFGNMQQSEKKIKKESFNRQSEKTAVVKDMEKTNSQSKIYSKESIKPNQILKTNRAIQFGQGREQLYSRIKRMKKIRRVEDISSREEIKKIEGHAPLSQDILIQALGKSKPIEAK